MHACGVETHRNQQAEFAAGCLLRHALAPRQPLHRRSLTSPHLGCSATTKRCLTALQPPPCSAVINRYGFNSKGVDAAALRLAELRRRRDEPGSGFPGGLVGVNLGKNKTSEDAAAGGPHPRPYDSFASTVTMWFNTACV